jgi:sirohydrochlorin ferrochelatase
LTSGYHAKTDIPTAAPQAHVSAAVGPDPLLAAVLADHLRDAGWTGQSPVVLAAAGSADPSAIDDVTTAAAQLAETLGVSVSAAFVSAGSPRLSEVQVGAVASYLVAPGHFAEEIAARGAPILGAPLGADARVIEVILARYDATVASMQPR